ncbi:ATP-binding protein [Rhizobium sp. 18065]|uniref:sensor histidine kinase n=1 Tax=Rhizobium sp. 18065 TaxID=2681411 RepID=UPI00135A73B5|nr:ATP-binding protein [Rhizobium sp. 18065]
MARLGLTARMLAIGATCLIAMWIIILAGYYRANGTAASPHPSPGQLVALADLLSRTPSVDRPQVLAAVRSATLDLTLQNAGTAARRDLGELSEPAEFADYKTALGDRLLSIASPERRARIVPALRRSNGQGLPLEFRIRLADASVLVVESRPPFATTVTGLPVGMGAGLVGTLIALLTLVLVQIEIRPLLKLAQAADRFDPSGPPIPLPRTAGRTPDVATLIRAFGRLQDRLQILMRTRLALISGVQHDVRSFATRLRLRVEAIPEARERDRAIKDIDDMIRLLDDALLSARAGSGALDEELIDLGTLLRSDIADMGRNGMAVALDPALPAGEVLVLGDRLALRRILSNLIDNAIKYGRVAHVGLAVSGQDAMITVRDEGPGIPAELRQTLLEPFIRGEPSRARQTGGAGLGLAIVRTLVEAHAGRIDIDTAPTGGAEIRVVLPLFCG